MSDGQDFTLLPAIDVRHGRVVRLAQGDYARETRYADDPLAVAEGFAAAGAQWLHLVDLDAARHGGWSLAALVPRLRDLGLRVQSGGGVRSAEMLAQMFDAGVERAVVGSLAVAQPELVCEWAGVHGAGRITVALDTRRDADGRWRLPTHGWTRSDPDAPLLETLCGRFAGAGLRHLLCTDIDRDGMLSGPNIELYRGLAARFPSLRIQASGGVRGLDDVRAARAAGCGGAVLGRALLEGRLDLRTALQDRPEQSPC
ncbi:HisA/HisF-related TIM barrel protein [Coralloluteibacterium stylophorae]|uniref:1-(5-phosphoribosyl)-5-[(5-phosphoribosylamino)methylideneamino] imidazole-4-carboxamide isomerase n=1 Tax=Coralloluteibacterium stylophorae TaxID=1776034 RepID=A0A8J8AX11_9GAMM|nr:HisA/HisF-related TIM barrel protein [Coralloluteibacterium stylophorae]MBS7455885.1 1-(5-phosphoribosyl)-5-((5-phosphoribosylamino)methylideneamino)imidazole-4-carboxamide isomerase [Coralloluteibacterium stylophorae]